MCFLTTSAKVKPFIQGDLKRLAERKKDLEYAYHYHERREDAVRAVIEVSRLDKDQVNRLYIAGRAVKRWRIRTEWPGCSLILCKGRLNASSLDLHLLLL